MIVTSRVEEARLPLRPAITIATAGLEGWRGVTLPYLNALVTASGFRPLESMTAVAPGPGEVLRDEELMTRVLEAGHRLGRGELESGPASLNVCPVCRCDSLRLNSDRATCPICDCEATVELDEDGVRLRFDSIVGSNQRWTPEGLRKHLVEWVQATGSRFPARHGETKVRLRPYRGMEMDWLCPASPDMG